MYDIFMLFEQLWINNCNDNAFNPENKLVIIYHLFLFHETKTIYLFRLRRVFVGARRDSSSIRDLVP